MFWTKESGFSPIVESFPGSFSFVLSLITLNISSIFYIYFFPPFVECIVQVPGYDNVLFFQEMLWTSHQSSCCLVVRSFQEKGFATRARFVLPGDRQPGTAARQGTQRNVDETCAVLKSPQYKEWAESFKKMDSMHFPGACGKEKTRLPGKHRAHAACGLWVIMVVSTRKWLSH